MLANWKLILPIVALALIAGAYFKGRADGDALAQANARRQVVEQITERNQINETVSGMSAADLCRELGGVFDGQCN
ncbi:MAG: hypothetical protein ACOH2T_29210 [Pseudomonas sp.]